MDGFAMDVYKKMKQLGMELPPPPGLGGIYFQAKEFGESLCYVSGTGPNIAGKILYEGKLGNEFTLEQGREAAVSAILNLLSVLQKNIGDLNRVKNVVKLLCFVASSDDFYKQPEVANTASQTLIDIFGEEVGKAARSAIGVNVLPGNIPIEIEALIELKK